MAHELILVVDDSRTGLMLTKMILLAAGFVVVTATTAEEALGVLADPHAELPALIVLDLNLPGMQGLEFAKRIRAVGCQIPMLAHTAYGRDWRYPQDCYAAGCNGYVDKNGDIDQLPRIVRLHLPEEAPEPAALPVLHPTAKGTH